MKTEHVKASAIVLSAMWEAGIIDDTHRHVMPIDDDTPEDHVHAVIAPFLIETHRGIMVDRAARAHLHALANYHDDMSEEPAQAASERAYARRLRDGVTKFALTL